MSEKPVPVKLDELESFMLELQNAVMEVFLPERSARNFGRTCVPEIKRFPKNMNCAGPARGRPCTWQIPRPAVYLNLLLMRLLSPFLLISQNTFSLRGKTWRPLNCFWKTMKAQSR